MTRRLWTILPLLALLLALAACADNTNEQAAHDPAVSGRIEAGLRVLTIPASAAGAVDFTIYRGDYVRLELPAGTSVRIDIPELDVAKTFPVGAEDKAYFKVPNTGRFAYTCGDVSGVIEALEYRATGYEETDATAAQDIIANLDPFILDVRTPGEFATGHLAGAALVPVQVLQQQVGKLAEHKDRPVFVYCRTGNRSTVAAKVLKDHGFGRVINLRRGIKEWQGKGYPVVK